jgi:hypothetical protein
MPSSLVHEAPLFLPFKYTDTASFGVDQTQAVAKENSLTGMNGLSQTHDVPHARVEQLNTHFDFHLSCRGACETPSKIFVRKQKWAFTHKRSEDFISYNTVQSVYIARICLYGRQLSKKRPTDSAPYSTASAERSPSHLSARDARNSLSVA